MSALDPTKKLRRFEDRTRWARFSFILDNDPRPVLWSDLNSEEKVAARITTAILARMLMKNSL